MTDTFRAMCAELVDSLENARRIIKGADGTLHINTAEFVLRRARAALAEPVGEGPSELELEAIELALWDKYRTKGWGGGEFMYDNNFSYALEEYRAALDRFGRPATLLQQQAAPSPAVAPVPVSERWPEYSDCDHAERVWCWSWALETWRLSRIKQSIHTHWLPANALPLP